MSNRGLEYLVGQWYVDHDMWWNSWSMRERMTYFLSQWGRYFLEHAHTTFFKLEITIAIAQQVLIQVWNTIKFKGEVTCVNEDDKEFPIILQACFRHEILQEFSKWIWGQYIWARRMLAFLMKNQVPLLKLEEPQKQGKIQYIAICKVAKSHSLVSLPEIWKVAMPEEAKWILHEGLIRNKLSNSHV